MWPIVTGMARRSIVSETWTKAERLSDVTGIPKDALVGLYRRTLWQRFVAHCDDRHWAWLAVEVVWVGGLFVAIAAIFS